MEIIKFSVWHVTSCDHVIRFVQLNYGLWLTICQHPEKFGGHKDMWLDGCVYLTISHQTFNSSRDHTSPPCQRIIWVHWLVLLTINHQPVMLGGQRPCGRGDIKLWVSYVTSRNHVIKGSSDLTGEFLLS